MPTTEEQRERKKQYMKKWHSEHDSSAYNNDPKNKARKAAWSKKYNQKPEVKQASAERMRKLYADPEYVEHRKELRSTPERIANRSERSKEYTSRPEVKDRMREYNKTPQRIAYAKEYRQNPEVKERNNKRKRESYKNNPEIKAARKAYGVEYKKRDDIKLKNSLKKKERIATDPQYRVNNAISCSIRRCLRNNKTLPSFEILDFTLDDLKTHLEKQFTDGMSWDNYGKNGWEIDHVIPVAAHNFEKPEDEDFKKCWSLENLQPMWGIENAAKGARVEKPFQPSLVFGVING